MEDDLDYPGQGRSMGTGNQAIISEPMILPITLATEPQHYWSNVTCTPMYSNSILYMTAIHILQRSYRASS